MITGFRHVCVTSGDLGRSVRFYKKLFGLKPTKTLTLEGEYLEKVLGGKGRKLTYVKMRAPGQKKGSPPIFELHHWHGRKARFGRWGGHVAFTISGLDREYKRLRRAGVKFVSGPVTDLAGRTRLCFCCDPDGNLIELMEDLRP